MTDDAPGSVRVRTGGENSYRFDAIEDAADFYGCNRSDAVAFACEDVEGVARAVEKVLERDDLTRRQAREISETFDAATRGISVDVDERAVTVKRD